MSTSKPTESYVSPYIGTAIEVPNGTKIGDDVVIAGQPTSIGEHVKIGARSWLCRGVKLGNRVTIGKHVKIGFNTEIGDGVTIKQDVIIGNGVTISDGVKIERGAVINDKTTVDSNTTQLKSWLRIWQRV